MNVSSLLRITAAERLNLSVRCHIFLAALAPQGFRVMVAKASNTNAFAVRWRMGHRYRAVSVPTDITVFLPAFMAPERRAATHGVALRS
jgi:hypothetical protein